MRSASKYLGVVAACLLALGLTVLQLELGAGTTTKPHAIGDVSPPGPNPNATRNAPLPATTNQNNEQAPPLLNVGSVTARSNSGHVKQPTHATHPAPAIHVTLLRVEQPSPVPTKGHCGCAHHPGNRHHRHHPQGHTHHRDHHGKHAHHRRHHRKDDDKGNEHKHTHHTPNDNTANKGKRYDDGAHDVSKSGSNSRTSQNVEQRRSVRSSERHGHNGNVSQSVSTRHSTNQPASSRTPTHAPISERSGVVKLLSRR